MRILSFNTIDSFARNHLEAATMVEWVEDALAHKQEAILPAKTVVDLDERLLGCPGTGFYDVMPAIVPTWVLRERSWWMGFRSGVLLWRRRLR